MSKDNDILTVKTLVDKINNIFLSITQDIVPLQLNLEPNDILISRPDILPKYIISEAEVYQQEIISHTCI